MSGETNISSKECPICGLWNVQYAKKCDCGYNFTTNNFEGKAIEKNRIYRWAMKHRLFLKLISITIISCIALYILIIYLGKLINNVILD